MLRRHLRVNTAAGALRRGFSSLGPAAGSNAWEPIESKWQKRWALEAQAAPPLAQDAAGKDKETFYCLAMFPYPSGPSCRAIDGVKQQCVALAAGRHAC
jgi:hypothetical protein